MTDVLAQNHKIHCIQINLGKN